MLADGAGGSAHGERSSVPLRRGHAWLHAATQGGEVITVLLGLDERARTDRGQWDLADWPGRDPGTPTANLERFEPDPWPTWRFRFGDAAIERSLFLVHGHHALVVSYRHIEGPAVRLRLSPLVVGRGPDAAQREHPDFGGLAKGIPGRVRIETRRNGPTLTLWHQGSFLPNRMWRRGIAHPIESRKSQEDALVPGHLDGLLSPGESLQVVASTEEALFRALAIEGRLGTPPPATLAECVAALAAGERSRQIATRGLALKGADYTARQAAAAHGDGLLARRLTPLIEASDPWTLPLARAIEQGLARRECIRAAAAGSPCSIRFPRRPSVALRPCGRSPGWCRSEPSTWCETSCAAWPRTWTMASRLRASTPRGARATSRPSPRCG